MFEFVRTHNRLLFLVMVLLIFPSFVFFGLQGYNRTSDGANTAVALVDGRKVTQAEWDAYRRQQIEQLRQQIPGLDAKMLDSPEMKKESLERLIRERVLYASAQQQHMTVTDDQLQREILQIPQLAQLKAADGSVDVGAYKALLQAQGYTPESFEASVRQGALLQQVLSVSGQVPASAAVAKVALDSYLQRRDVQLQTFEPKAYTAKVKPTDEEVQAHYKTNEAVYRTSEQASIEYVTLDADALMRGVAVSAEDARKYYDQNVTRFTATQERQASHILIVADKAAPAEQRKAAKTEAERILAELRKTPDQFAAMAKKLSQDPGSAAQGGDLGFQKREAWVPAFADAVFAMKQGEISNVVESDFGYHIIRLQATRGGDVKPFEAVKAQVEEDIRKQQAQKLYADSTEGFGNTAYEQSDSLQPLLDKYKLTKQSATVARAPAPAASGPLESPRLLEAVFSDDVLKNKRNSPAVETGRSQLTVARLVEHRPARVRPFDEVKEQVRASVVQQQAAALARKEGEARLAQLKTAGDAAGLGAVITLSRFKTENQPQEVINAALSAASPLPQVMGVDLGAGGYAVVRVNKITPPPPDSPEVAEMAPRYAQAWAVAQSQAYYEALKKRMDTQILIDPAKVEPLAAR